MSTSRPEQDVIIAQAVALGFEFDHVRQPISGGDPDIVGKPEYGLGYWYFRNTDPAKCPNHGEWCGPGNTKAHAARWALALYKKAHTPNTRAA